MGAQYIAQLQTQLARWPRRCGSAPADLDPGAEAARRELRGIAKYCRRAGAGVRNNMALKLGPTGLGFGIDKDRQDFTIYSGGWAMGRIYEQRGGPDSMRWFWSLHGIFGKPADMRADGHAATLDEAKAQFESIWRRWLAWAKLREDT